MAEVARSGDIGMGSEEEEEEGARKTRAVGGAACGGSLCGCAAGGGRSTLPSRSLPSTAGAVAVAP